jgi:hypothetical protein
MPCVWAFAQTEKIIRREEYVSVPEEWHDIVLSVSKKFSVVRADQDMVLDFKQHLQQFFKKMIKNKTASFTVSRYWNMAVNEEKSLYPLNRAMVCSKFCIFKTKQKSPHFDAPTAH